MKLFTEEITNQGCFFRIPAPCELYQMSRHRYGGPEGVGPNRHDHFRTCALNYERIFALAGSRAGLHKASLECRDGLGVIGFDQEPRFPECDRQHDKEQIENDECDGKSAICRGRFGNRQSKQHETGDADYEDRIECDQRASLPQRWSITSRDDYRPQRNHNDIGDDPRQRQRQLILRAALSDSRRLVSLRRRSASRTPTLSFCRGR